MTDKEQIIIDGVNISKCKFFNNITESHYCFGIPCKDRPNCYFKQLQRSVVRIKDLEERIMGHSKTVEEYCDKLARKTQEFEQLQEKYEALKLENEEGYEIVDELKHECEELKAYAQRQENQREEYYKEYLKLSQECEELKEEIKGLKDYIKWIMRLQ